MSVEPPSVAVIGCVSWNQSVDVPALPRGGSQTLQATGMRWGVGSTGAGKALHLSRLGFDTRLHALLGRDEDGDRAAEVLTGAGVRFQRVDDPAGTEHHVNLMDPHGGRVSVFTTSATVEPGITGEELSVFVGDAEHVWVNVANYARAVLPWLTGTGREVWVDIHDWDGHSDYSRDFVRASTHLFMSDEGNPDALGLAARLAPGRKVVVVTHGRRGATAFRGDARPMWIAPVPVEPVDANGAGDGFCAGVMFGRVRGWDWATSLRAGAIVGASAVGSVELASPELSAAWLCNHPALYD